jgi:hypothetical protein
MSSYLGQWYELGIMDYGSKLKRKTKSAVIPVGDGRAFNGFGRYGYDAGWRYQKVDVSVKPRIFTIFRRAKDGSRAKKMGSRLGTVLSCHKVSEHFHYEKIEFLNLRQTPMTVTIEQEDEFILNSQGELTPTMRATRNELEKKYEIAIDFSE